MFICKRCLGVTRSHVSVHSVWTLLCLPFSLYDNTKEGDNSIKPFVCLSVSMTCYSMLFYTCVFGVDPSSERSLIWSNWDNMHHAIVLRSVLLVRHSPL